MFKKIDLDCYLKLTEYYEFQQLQQTFYASSFVLHFVMKIIPLTMYLMINLFSSYIGVDTVNELIAIFAVFDFWITKNINGRRMIGIKWYFENDRNGSERFTFQCRVNPDLVSATSARLFWLILCVYALLPSIFVVTSFIIVPNMEAVEPRILILNAIIFTCATSNIFLFWKASSAAAQRQQNMRKKLGQQFVRNMEDASIISYL